jgi:EAL and modified HD-GYP domain-containing signal transduction protein
LLIVPKNYWLPIFVGRQTIYDADLNIWGHELLFRSSGQDNYAQFSNQEQATAAVITEGFSIGTASLPKGRKIFINFPQGLLLKDAPLALPHEDCIIEILENVEPTPELLASLRKLKDSGYTIALDDYVGQPEFAPLLELADIVKVDVLGRSPTETIKVSQKLRKHNCLLLAEKIEHKHILDLTKSLGFTLFQGFFFARPEVIAGRSIPAAAITRLRLIQEMNGDRFEVAEVTKIISQDLSTSLKLLKQINSVYYSFTQKIRSIPQAITLMGSRQLKQWLMLAMLADINPGCRARELLFSCVHRARFLEMLALDLKSRKFEPDAMFLLGLFSNLDAMLNLPMEDILSHLPLDQEIHDALSGKHNDMRPWIDLSIAVERGEWARLDSMLHSFRLDEKETASKYIHAADWAFKMLDFQGDESLSFG